jgi:NADPH-dependent curcumin reductase CurA
VKRARAQGFIIFDHQDRYAASVAQLATWVREGRLRYAEDVLEGLEAAPTRSPASTEARTRASASSACP